MIYSVCVTFAIPAYADCNRFENIQSIILSEGANQPLAAKIEMARVIHTKGDCYLDEHYYSGYGIARSVLETNPSACASNVHCSAYFMLYSIAADERESAAIAAYIVLTEYPTPRYHFDAADAPLAYFWNSPIACPNGYWVVGDIRVC